MLDCDRQGFWPSFRIARLMEFDLNSKRSDVLWNTCSFPTSLVVATSLAAAPTTLTGMAAEEDELNDGEADAVEPDVLVDEADDDPLDTPLRSRSSSRSFAWNTRPKILTAAIHPTDPWSRCLESLSPLTCNHVNECYKSNFSCAWTMKTRVTAIAELDTLYPKGNQSEWHLNIYHGANGKSSPQL